jgi:hypothetical protein
MLALLSCNCFARWISLAAREDQVISGRDHVALVRMRVVVAILPAAETARQGGVHAARAGARTGTLPDGAG